MISNEDLELKQARSFLGMFKEFPPSESMQEPYRKALRVLLLRGNEEDQKLAQERMLGVPTSSPVSKKLKTVPLEARYIHRIWVEGDVLGSKEFQDGIATQPKVEGWTNLLWVYNGLLGPERWEELEGRRLASEGMRQYLNKQFLQVNFRKTMAEWDDRPEWLTRYLDYLDAMLPKKAYVAMGDLMRMIVLWFMGGVYVDVKIQFVGTAKAFLQEPQVAPDRLMCVYSGRMENWAMMSQPGCPMAEEILIKGLKRLPSLEKIGQMPVNWSHPSGKYSKAHAELHEDKSVWPILQMQYREHVVMFNEVEPALQLHNPRELNSWENDDGVLFDWKE